MIGFFCVQELIIPIKKPAILLQVFFYLINVHIKTFLSQQNEKHLRWQRFHHYHFHVLHFH